MVSLVLDSFTSSQNTFPVFFPIKSIRISKNPGVSAHRFKMDGAIEGKENGEKSLFCVYTSV